MELVGFLKSATDVKQLEVLADYIDEKYPATPVLRGGRTLPVGFYRQYILRHRLRTFNYMKAVLRVGTAAAEPFKPPVLYYCGTADVNVALRGDVPWYDHPAATTIGGLPAFVSEPYMRPEEEKKALELAHLARQRLGWATSFSRAAAHHPNCGRIAVYFTVEYPFMPLPDLPDDEDDWYDEYEE